MRHHPHDAGYSGASSPWFALPPELARIGSYDSCEAPQEGRLAGPVIPHNGQGLSNLEVKIELSQHLLAIESFRQANRS
jgi:hypothetical protein